MLMKILTKFDFQGSFLPRFANDFDEFASLSENEKRRSIRLLKKKIGYPQTAYWLLIGILKRLFSGVFTMPNQAEQ